jgi:hypothetical protein
LSIRVIVDVVLTALVEQMLADMCIGTDADPAVGVRHDPFTGQVQPGVVEGAQQDQIV